MNIRLPFREQELFRFVNTVLLSCIIVLGCGGLLGIKDTGGKHAAVVVAIAVMILLLHILLYKKVLFGIFSVLLLILLVMGTIGLQVSKEFLNSYINWITNRPDWNPEWVFGYSVMQILWVVVICYLFLLFTENYFYIKVAMLTGIVVWLLYCMISRQNVIPLFAGCSITFVFLILTEWTQRKWKKVRTQSIFACMNWLLPFVMVYFILLLNMPVSPKPYDWQFVKKAKEDLEDTILAVSLKFFPEYGEPEFVFSGFSEEGSLKESLNENDKKVMVLRTNGQLKTNVYLVGKIFHAFDGREWTANAEMYPNELYLDTAKTVCAVRSYDNEFFMDYIGYTFMDICYEYLSTQTLFVPIKTYDVESNQRNVEVLAKDGNFMLEEKQDFGTVFDVGFYQMNSGSDFFRTLPQTEPDAVVVEDVLADLNARTGVELKPEDFDAYEEFCYENYLSDIALSKETEEYIAEILQDAVSDVDKLIAIEQELNSFEYSFDSGEIPEEVIDAGTFLDYFLLEKRQGYCTHFATAFALLAQSQGIPARYVHGYCIPAGKPGDVPVTASMAHAWPEVYIKNIGWIPFEPTPGYGEVRYGSWETKKGSLIADIEREKYWNAKDVYAEKFGDTDDMTEAGNKVSFSVYIRKILSRVLRIVLLLAAAVVLLALEEYLRSSYILSKMSQEKRYGYKVRQAFKILTCLGMHRLDAETLSEYRARIREELPGNMSLQFMEEYEMLLYGNKQVDGKMWEVLLRENEELLGILQERKRFRYIIYKLFGR